MNKEMKDKKLADETLDMVSGGSIDETISDNKMAAAMLGKDTNSKLVISGDLARSIFQTAGVKVYENRGGNTYEFGGQRISRYEALVRMTRALHINRHFDITPYMEDTHRDNIFDKGD